MYNRLVLTSTFWDSALDMTWLSTAAMEEAIKEAQELKQDMRFEPESWLGMEIILKTELKHRFAETSKFWMNFDTYLKYSFSIIKVM